MPVLCRFSTGAQRLFLSRLVSTAQISKQNLYLHTFAKGFVTFVHNDLNCNHLRHLEFLKWSLEISGLELGSNLTTSLQTQQSFRRSLSFLALKTNAVQVNVHPACILWIDSQYKN